MDSWAEIVKGNDFTAHASASERSILVRLTGTADLTVKSHFDGFLREVHTEAQRRLADVVTVDVRQLDFINSSCLKSFVWWISTVQERVGAARYRIIFVSSPTVYWQRRSLNALACLASDIISIQS